MRHGIEALLLFMGIAVELLCCAGVMRMRIVYDRLHYLAPASFLGPVLIGAAIVVRFHSLLMALTTAVIVTVMAISGPVVSRVLARAARVRAAGTVTPEPDELTRGAS